MRHCDDPAFDPDFDWDDANVDHIESRHGVTPTGAEDAILDPNRVPARAESTATERRFGILGKTEQGRILFVSFTVRDDAIRVVTAYDASNRQKRQYRRGRR